MTYTCYQCTVNSPFEDMRYVYDGEDEEDDYNGICKLCAAKGIIELKKLPQNINLVMIHEGTADYREAVHTLLLKYGPGSHIINSDEKSGTITLSYRSGPNGEIGDEFWKYIKENRISDRSACNYYWQEIELCVPRFCSCC